MKTELRCEVCGLVFSRAQAEVNRNKKKGRKVYCSLRCSGKANACNIPDHFKGNTSFLPSGKSVDEFSSFRYYLRKARSRERWGECDLSLEYLKELWSIQEGKCAYSDIEMDLYEYKSRNIPTTASLDRVDSQRGYVKGNVHFVCFSLNLAKSTFSDAEFLEFLEKIRSN